MKKNVLKLILVAIIMVGSFGIVKNAWAGMNWSNGTWYGGFNYTPTSNENITGVVMRYICKEADNDSGTFWLNIVSDGAGYNVLATSTIYNMSELNYYANCDTGSTVNDSHVFQFTSYALTSGTKYRFMLDRTGNNVGQHNQVATSSTFDMEASAYSAVWTENSYTDSDIGSYNYLKIVEDGYDENEGLSIIFPLDGDTINNSDFSDWTVLYQLPDTIEFDEWYLRIGYWDEGGINYYYDDEWLTSTTTDPHEWTIERDALEYMEGNYQAIAEIAGFEGDNCQIATSSCASWLVLQSEINSFTATTTGRDIFGYRPDGFYYDTEYVYNEVLGYGLDASSTDRCENLNPFATDSKLFTTGACFLVSIKEQFANIFPLNIWLQIRELFYYMAGNNDYPDGINIELGDILHDDVKQYASTTAPILHHDLVNDNMTIWEDNIYEFMEYIVYTAGFLFVLVFFFVNRGEPDSK